jgi:hypothetical protein
MRRIVVQSQSGQIVHEILSQKKKQNKQENPSHTNTKKRLVEWLKALGLSPSTPCPLKKKKI